MFLDGNNGKNQNQNKISKYAIQLWKFFDRKENKRDQRTAFF